MTLLVPDNSKMHLLRIITGHLSRSTIKVHLFINDIIPSITDNINDYTELNEGNYAPIELNEVLWTFTVNAPVEATHNLISFTLSGVTPDTIVYGYYITMDNKLLWVERFTVPWTFVEDFDKLQIRVKLEMKQ